METKEQTKIYLNKEEQREVGRAIEKVLESNHLSFEEEIDYVYEVYPLTEESVRLHTSLRGIEEDYDTVLKELEEKNAEIIKNELWKLSYEQFKKTLQKY